MTFGEKLREARQKAGLSQEELSNQLAVSRSAVAKWETDKGMPDIHNIKAIARLLNISIDYLLDDGTALDLSVIREPIDLKGVNGFIKKTKAKETFVKERFSGYKIWCLTAEQKMTKAEKVRDELLGWFTALLPDIGVFDSGTDIVHAVENKDKSFYLAENETKQFWIMVTDEYMEIHGLAQRIMDKKFEIGDWKLKKGGRTL